MADRRLDDFHMSGYTGHLPGVRGEVIGRTPKVAQAEAASPSKASLLAARGAPPPPLKGGAGADTLEAAAAANLGSAGPPNLWPSMQTTAMQPPAKPQVSTLATKIGDERIPAFVSLSREQFPAPFGQKISSPLRNKALASADLSAVYRSALGRVGEKRLEDIHHHMRERVQGKLGNRNDNAFKLRKLFKMYDEDGSGYCDIEGFRLMSEAFGIQFDDDSLLALFSRYDPEVTGRMRYHALMRNLLDEDTYRLWCGAHDPLAGSA